jgi:hypothetical protein
MIGQRFALITLLALIAAAPVHAADEAQKTRPLTDQRWHDRAYGLSFLVPQDMRVVSRTADTAAARVEDERRQLSISLHVKRSRSILTLKQVAQEAREQILSRISVNHILEEKTNLTLAGQPAATLYAQTKNGEGEDILLGQAILQLDPQTFAVMEVTSALKDYVPAHDTFEAVLASMQRMNPEQIAQQRAEQIKLGVEWRTELRSEQIHKALIPEQWFRILEGDKDLGYMRVRQNKANQAGKSGVAVEIQSRLAAGPHYYDTLAASFLADDDSVEMWKVTTTRRSIASRPNADAKAKSQQEETYVETGVRAGEQITVNFDGPRQADKRKYARPEKGYLAQVEAWLLPQLLPIDRPGTYGFYFYASNNNAVGFRTDTVTPTLTGFTIATRLSPNDPELKATYNAKRQLIEKQLGEGRRLAPTSAAMIQQLWKNR